LEKTSGSSDMNRFLYLLFNGEELVQNAPSSQRLVRDAWLGHSNMQMMTARDREGNADGLYLAAWGGHNAQSHNHNDVGNFVVFANGKPVLIDIGRPTYTRQTFSSRRYEIWAFQSGFHNLPTINGVDQKAGRQYTAKQVSYDTNDSMAVMEMDIANAYPEKAGIESWNRTVRLNRGKSIQVIDRYELKAPSGDVIENFIVAGKVIESEPGKLLLNDREETVRLRFDYNPAKLSAAIEPVELKDSKLRRIWGECLYRIRLKAKTAAQKNRLEFHLSIVK